jgi:site-specific recombinase XerD
MVNLDELWGGERSNGAVSKLLLGEVVESYLTYYAVGSNHTAKAKRLDLRTFLQYLVKLRGVSTKEELRIRDWDFAAVQRFVEDRLARGEAPTTVARRLATLKHMGRVLSERVAGFVNPARDVKAPRVQPGKPKGLTPAEVKELRQRAMGRIAERNTFIRRRNATLVSFLLETGLRADEVRLLRMHQLEESLEKIKGVRTKGRRFRDLYLPKTFRAALQLYLDDRRTLLQRNFPALSATKRRQLPVFISTYTASTEDPESFLMGAKSVYRAVRELSAELKLHPHLLRHSFAIDLLESCRDVRLVAQALGHSDVRVTMRYTERREEEMAEALERRSQRGS